MFHWASFFTYEKCRCLQYVVQTQRSGTLNCFQKHLPIGQKMEFKNILFHFSKFYVSSPTNKRTNVLYKLLENLFTTSLCYLQIPVYWLFMNCFSLPSKRSIRLNPQTFRSSACKCWWIENFCKYVYLGKQVTNPKPFPANQFQQAPACLNKNGYK